MIRIPKYRFDISTQSDWLLSIKDTNSPNQLCESTYLNQNTQDNMSTDRIESEYSFNRGIESKKFTELTKLFNEIAEANIEYKDLPNTVLYDGNPDSPIMVIGEGPGENEVLQKKPFVGKSGTLLQQMLNAAGLIRSNIYVTNVVVWRPPNNRTPLPNEIDEMRSYIMKHISIINPAVLILVGGISYRCVMKTPVAISKIRGNWHEEDFCKNIINIFHPSYLLRSPSHKKETWHDILTIRQRLVDLGHADWLTGGLLYNI